jgi:hypothetical protein
LQISRDSPAGFIPDISGWEDPSVLRLTRRKATANPLRKLADKSLDGPNPLQVDDSQEIGLYPRK